jgi:UDP-N-acetylglucosamine--N-acetylmuramyl-(pentapeptide) pyrophosphoryl-undecaprenol N-acetylglucosamine transferase
VIFATVGTHGQPFTRFLDALAGLDDDVVVQYGHNPRPAGVHEAVAFMPFDELNARMREADVVVTHAGVGSVLCARQAGHVPVVVPRLHRYGEHVDDHQLQITTEMEAAGMVVAAVDATALPGAIDAARTRKAALPGHGDLKQAVRDATEEAPRTRPRLSLRSVVAGARAR